MKIITYKIESPYLSNKLLSKDIINESELKSVNNSSYENKNIESERQENNSNIKHNYIKLIFTLEPNTLEGTKLLTITMIDYSETLNIEQLKDIIKSMFDNFLEVIIQQIPLTKNCESIIIDANINIVYNYWANWQFPSNNEFVTNIKTNGDPQKIGNKINFVYLKKYNVISIVEEANSYFQEGNEDDNNEWNYKHKATFEDGQSISYNAIFVSCENGTKTYLSLENDINYKIESKENEFLSKRKLSLLNNSKNYIEKNKDFLIRFLKK